MNALPRAEGPVRGRFPGELALRDLTGEEQHRLASVITARMLVMQLAERYTEGAFVASCLAAEVTAVRAYIEPIRARFPLDAARLDRVLDRIARGDARAIASALLAAADTTMLHTHALGAYGFAHAAYAHGVTQASDAAALSAAARLRDLARTLGRADLVSRWDKRARRLVARCR